MRGGEEVKISKRAGSYVTLRDLIDWTSRDAVRFFLISRKADTEFTFDVDLALKQNDENPVFYVQYAHARICSVLEQYAAQGGDVAGARRDADLGRLRRRAKPRCCSKLADYPPMLAAAAADLAPHEVAFYLRDLAAAFHSYYAAERFLVDDAELARRPPGAAGGDAPGAPQRAGRARRRRARAHGRERPDTGMKASARSAPRQRGGFLIGLVVGLLIGLALALGVALYVTKAPIPFVNKVPQRTAEQDAAEAERNRNWDPEQRRWPAEPGAAPASGAVAGAAPPATAGAAAAAGHRSGRCRDAAARRPARRPPAPAPPTAAARRRRRARRRPLAATGRRPVHLLRAGRRLRPQRRRRAAARQAGDARRREPADRARAGRPHGLPGPRRPVRQEGRCRTRQGKARRCGRRLGAGRGFRSKVAPRRDAADGRARLQADSARSP